MAESTTASLFLEKLRLDAPEDYKLLCNTYMARRFKLPAGADSYASHIESLQGLMEGENGASNAFVISDSEDRLTDECDSLTAFYRDLRDNLLHRRPRPC